MIDFLISKFIVNNSSISDPSVRRSYGTFAGMVGIIVNLTLSIAKIAAGALYGSISVTADGINNLSDAASSVVTVIGFKLSGKPADREHPFGHERIEYLAGFILGIVILVVGLELIKTSVNRILSPRPAIFSNIMISILIISTAVKIWLAKFYSRIAAIMSSSAVKAASADSMYDALTTLSVRCGVFVSNYFKCQIDGWIGVGVGLFILWSGISVIRPLLGPILGESPDPDLVQRIESEILSYEGIINIHDLVVHSYGPNVIFATVHAEVDSKEDILKTHSLIDRIERDFAVNMNINLVIHTDPIITDDKDALILKNMTENIIKSVDPSLSIHDFRVIRGGPRTKLIFDVLIPSEQRFPETKTVQRIRELIEERDPGLYPLITLDKNYITKHVD